MSAECPTRPSRALLPGASAASRTRPATRQRHISRSDRRASHLSMCDVRVRTPETSSRHVRMARSRPTLNPVFNEPGRLLGASNSVAPENAHLTGAAQPQTIEPWRQSPTSNHKITSRKTSPLTVSAPVWAPGQSSSSPSRKPSPFVPGGKKSNRSGYLSPARAGHTSIGEFPESLTLTTSAVRKSSATQRANSIPKNLTCRHRDGRNRL